MQKTINNILFSQFISIIYYAAKTTVQKTRSYYNKNNYYVFLVNKSEKGEKNGIMFVKTYVLCSAANKTLVEQSRKQSVSGQFNRHFGFIFIENNSEPLSGVEVQHTIAHELGHGAFTLYHTFSNKDKGITQGGTYNLLDYSTKTPNNLLRKYQWYIIHNPRLSLFGGDEEEVSDYVTEGLFSNHNFGLNEDDGTFTFITPTAQFILLPDNVKNVTTFFGYYGASINQENLNKFFYTTPGTLKSFEIGEVKYSAKIKKSGDNYVLTGYYDDTDKLYKHDNLEINDGNSAEGIILELDNDGYNIFQLDINNLEKFINGSPLVDVINFPLSFFDDINSKKIEFEQGNSQYSVNHETFKWAFKNNSDLTNSTLLIRNKIAELKALYPRYMDKTTEYYGDWEIGNLCSHYIGKSFDIYIRDIYCRKVEGGYAPYDNSSAPKNSLGWFSLYYNYLTENIHKLASEVGATLLIYNSDPSIIGKKETSLFNILRAINLANQKDIQNLKTETIYYILSRIGNEKAIFASSQEYMDEEGAIVKLINNINPNIAEKIIEKLEGKNHYNKDEYLYEQLFGATDDVYFGFIGNDNNRNALVSGFVKLMLNAPELYEKRLNLLLENPDERTYELEYQNIIIRGLINGIEPLKFYAEHFTTPKSDLKTSTIKTKFLENGKIEVIRAEAIGFSSSNIGKELEYSPFDLIYFVNKTNVDNLRTFNSSKNNEKDIEKADIPLPAIVLAYGDATTSQQTLEQGVYTTMDVASFATGVGSLTVLSKLSRLRQAITIVDMSADLSSMAATVASDNAELSSDLNNLAAISGIFSLSANGVPTIKNIYTKLENNKIVIPNLKETNKEIASLTDDELSKWLAPDENYIRARHFHEKQLPTIKNDDLRINTQKSIDRLNNARKTNVSVPIDQDAILNLFDEFKNLNVTVNGKTINIFENTEDACMYRAYLMLEKMKEKGIKAEKAFLISLNSLREADLAYNGQKVWKYHVAPVVDHYDETGILQKYVLDPALFDNPVLVDEWFKKMTSKNLDHIENNQKLIDDFSKPKNERKYWVEEDEFKENSGFYFFSDNNVVDPYSLLKKKQVVEETMNALFEKLYIDKKSSEIMDIFNKKIRKDNTLYYFENIDKYNKFISSVKETFNLNEQIYFVYKNNIILKDIIVKNTTPLTYVSCVDGLINSEKAKMYYYLYSNTMNVKPTTYNSLIDGFKKKYSKEELTEFKIKNPTLLRIMQDECAKMYEDFIKDMDFK